MIDQAAKDFFDKIKAHVDPCGSRVTCNPPPIDTDADFLVQIHPDYTADVWNTLDTLGWEREGSSEHYQFKTTDGFSSFRKGKVNLIVSANEYFCAQHRLATIECTRLNLMDKKERIALFRAYLYGELRGSGDLR